MIHAPPHSFSASTLCHYCGCQTLPPKKHLLSSDMLRMKDHVVPRAKLGRGVAGITVTACRRCNHAKSDHDYEEFKLFAMTCLRGRKPRPTVAVAILMFEAWMAGRVLA